MPIKKKIAKLKKIKNARGKLRKPRLGKSSVAQKPIIGKKYRC